MKKDFEKSADPLVKALLSAETLDELKKVCDDFSSKEREKIEDRLMRERIKQTLKIERAVLKLKALGRLT